MTTNHPTQRSPLFGSSGTGEAVIDLIHEIPDTSTISENSFLVETPEPQTAFVVRTQFIGVRRDDLNANSSSFLAAKRRRRSKRVSVLIGELSRHVDDDCFEASTHQVLSEVRDLLRFLTEAQAGERVQSEGNACEILRQIRDSLMRSGWQKYRVPSVRSAVMAVISPLVIEDDITAEHADRCMDVLLDCGLEPVLEPEFHG